jgi:hypothetical protein
VDSQNATAFGTLGFRLALHDLTDPPIGWASLSDVEILDARVRFDWERRALTLDRLTFASLMALHPLAVEPHPSWRIVAFGERLHDGAIADGFAHGLDGSIGGTVATRGRGLSLFLMADLYTAFLPAGGGIDGSIVRVGAGPFGGLRVQTGDTAVLVTCAGSYLPWQKIHETFDARAEIKTALARDLALGIEADAQPLSVEGQLLGYIYF